MNGTRPYSSQGKKEVLSVVMVKNFENLCHSLLNVPIGVYILLYILWLGLRTSADGGVALWHPGC